MVTNDDDDDDDGDDDDDDDPVCGVPLCSCGLEHATSAIHTSLRITARSVP